MLSTAVLAGSFLVAGVLTHPVVEERAGAFKFYPLPSPLTGICDLANGTDGALWGEDILENYIVRLDPTTGNIEQYPIPFTTPISNATIPGINNPLIRDRTAFSCAIRPGADGMMYATNGVRDQLVRINPQTKKIDVLGPPDPLGNLFPFNDLYSSPDGLYLTQTTGNTFMFYSFKTEQFTTYHVPTPLALPLGVFVASDENVYIPELLGNKILVFNPTTKAINEYEMPELEQAPAVVRAEKDGYVYFSLFTGDGIGRINMKTHKIDVFHSHQLLGLGAVTTGPDAGGDVWLSYFTIDRIARLNTKTNTFSFVPFPGTFAQHKVPGSKTD